MKQHNFDHWKDELPKFGYMHIREESRKKVDHPYYVFGDLMEIPKYGDFLIKKSSKSGDFGNFFFFFPPQKSFVWIALDLFILDFWGHQFVII